MTICNLIILSTIFLSYYSKLPLLPLLQKGLLLIQLPSCQKCNLKSKIEHATLYNQDQFKHSAIPYCLIVSIKE